MLQGLIAAKSQLWIAVALRDGVSEKNELIIGDLR